MDNFYGRSVFFVADAEQSLRFYTKTLGFRLDWNHQQDGKAFVSQVSLHGFELILNQVEPATAGRAGHGRVFIGLNDEQAALFRQHLKEHGIETTLLQWGAPTVVVHDLDKNEMFFWLAPDSSAARDPGAERAETL
jgi:catechol 2,3-dioxygenase-like lactoylglutathione lyase family enzyme